MKNPLLLGVYDITLLVDLPYLSALPIDEWISRQNFIVKVCVAGICGMQL